MNLLNNTQSYKYASFAFVNPGAITRGLKRASTVVSQGIHGAGEQAAVAGKSAITALNQPFNDAAYIRDLAEEGRRARGSFLGKAGHVAGIVGAASTPLFVAPLFIKDANTRAVEQFRDEDKRREAQGLPALTKSPAQVAEEAGNAHAESLNLPQTNSNGNIRVANPAAGKFLLPGAFPPNSLR